MKDPLIGQQLANFRIESVLGRGGMAQVYYGLDIKLQRPVAIKVIDARYRGKPAYAKRFVNEARVLAKWRHEHILQIYYADDEDDLYYYVMEFIDGQNLETIMASYAIDGELMPIADILRIGNAISDALDYAHGQGVIHRDIKPSNILVSRNGRVVLGDFGLAMDLHDGSLGETFGTPHYISPEQASRSANAVPQSDLYSLGVILYEMLVGVVPFNDPSPTSVALQHITEPPPSPRSINPDLSKEVEEVLLKALEKSPKDRYQSGSELMTALNAALKVKPNRTKPPLPPLPVGVPTITRRPLSKESVTKRVSSTPITSHISSHGSDVALPKQPQKNTEKAAKRLPKLRLLFVSLLFLLAVGFAWTQGWFRPGAFSNLVLLQPAQPTVVVADETKPPTVTITQPTQAPPTKTLTPSPSATVSFPTPLPSGTATLASLPTEIFTLAPETDNPDLSAIPAIPTEFVVDASNGHRFRLYYDENSIYLHNLSDVSRSISGFTFERLNSEGDILNIFGGWEWGRFFPNITPNRCMAIELYLASPFLKPSECVEPYLSLINPPRESDTTFWTTQENSKEFRVLWQQKEVSRCKIGEGGCEFFVP